jgi:hypothetical protein
MAWARVGAVLALLVGSATLPGLGPMGQSAPPQILSALAALTQRWQAADPKTPTRCALQLIAVVAQDSPGPANLYRGRASAATIHKVIGWGRERGCLTILDVHIRLVFNMDGFGPVSEKALVVCGGATRYADEPDGYEVVLQT